MDPLEKNPRKFKETNLFTGCSFKFKVIEVVHLQNSILKLHWHDYLELLYFVEGQATINIGSASYEVSAGDILFVNCGQLHSGYSRSGSLVRYYAVVIDPSVFANEVNDSYYKKFIQPYLEGKRLFHVKPDRLSPYYRKLKTSVKSIIREFKDSRPGFELKIKVGLYSLIVDYIRSYFPMDSADAAAEDAVREAGSIRNLLSYIYLVCPRKMTVAEAADYVQLSPFYFCKMFKKITSQTFIEFLNKYKISRAEEFLLYTNDSISDIANELGFCNTNYFDKVFRSVNGCSPSAFRKQTGKLNPEGSL
jgi:AraC-like DNA-binding protein/mannose-6-phosphate isomerase-like protein (cupin superfamily)